MGRVKKNIWLLILLFGVKNIYSQTILNDSMPDTDSKFDTVNFKSYHNWAGKYRSRSYFSNGKIRRRSNCDLFNVLQSKSWDSLGNVLIKSRQRPFPRTSYTYVSREKTYDEKGHLIKFEFTKKAVSCYGGRGLIRNKIIIYNDKGKIISKTKLSRKETWKKYKQQQDITRQKLGGG